MAELVFELKRHESILSTLARYLAGHTEYVNDFSEGSITRSLIEGVSQELYRQNVSFGQGITSSLESAIKSAFNLPLQNSSRASGDFTAYRQMLPAPDNVDVQFSTPAIDVNNNRASFTGSIDGNVLTVSALTGSLGLGQGISGTNVAAGTYIAERGNTSSQFIIGPSCSFIGTIANYTLTVSSVINGSLKVGQVISTSSNSYGTITDFLSGSGGTGTYYLSTSSTVSVSTAMIAGRQTVSSTTMKSFSLLNPVSLLSIVASSTVTNPIPAGTYYYSVVPVFGLASAGITREFTGSAPYPITLNSASRVNITWSPCSYFTGYRIYRSTSPFMLNASYTYVDIGTSSFLEDQSTNTYVSRKWPGIFLTYGVSASNLTNNSPAESMATLISSVPTGTVASLTWSRSTSIDSLSSPTGYNVYKSTFDAIMPVPMRLSASLSATTGTLSYGSNISYAMFVGNIMTVFSASHLTFGSLSPDQVLTSSSTLYSNTTILRQISGTTGYEGTYLVNQYYDCPTPTGSGMQITVQTLSGSAVATAQVSVVGSGYLSGQSGTLYCALATPSGGAAAYCAVTITNGAPTLNASVAIIYGGSGYTTGAKTVSLLPNTVFAASVSGTIQYYYKVSTLTSGAESYVSSSVSITAQQSYRSVYLSWDEIAGAIGYRVYRDNSSTFDSPSFYDVTTPFMTDTGSQFSTITCDAPTTFLLSASSTPNTLGFTDTGLIGTKSGWPFNPSAYSVQGPIMIPAGTEVRVGNTQLTYSYPQSVTMSSTTNEITSTIVCNDYGILGNTGANNITQFASPIYGISGGTNLRDIINGRDVETEYEWKSRFRQTLEATARGTRDAIIAGAVGTKIYDSNGFITDQVTKAIITEPSTLNLYVYIHNSTKYGVSSALVSETKKIIDGYTLDSGIKVPGYKAAGIPVTVIAASIYSQDIVIDVTPRPGFSINIIKDNLTAEINRYFNTLDISDGLYIPSITTVTTTSANQNISYQYRIVAIDSNGNKSAASLINSSLTTGNIVPNNTITWDVKSGGPTISFYDILRWDGYAWNLVETIPAGSPYLVSAATLSYTDTRTTLQPYSFTQYGAVYFQKSVLQQLLQRTPGVLTLSMTIPTSAGVDQTVIIPPAGGIVVPGNIVVK